jgi:transposase
VGYGSDLLIVILPNLAAGCKVFARGTAHIRQDSWLSRIVDEEHMFLSEMSHLVTFLAISIRCGYSFLVPEEEMEGYPHAMATPTLLPDPTCLHLTLLDGSSAAITAVVITTSEEAECPLCHWRSARIHSRYVRSVADLPWMGCAVRLQLHVRRFFCPNPQCVRQIFSERLPSVVEPYARRTTRLTDVFTLIGFALGGEAGERLVKGMGLSTSPDTLLRLIRAQPEEQAPTPRVLGVDDFSFCKRKSYGTILIDLERRIPIDLLPDREAATLEKWLKEHKGVEIISRDRGGPYAEGAKLGAPNAQQVADRWHLLSNLSETMKGFFLNKKAQLDALVQKPSETLSEEEASQLTPWYAGMSVSKRQEEKSVRLHQERVERYHQIHDLHAKKVDPANIARQVGISRQSVYVYLKMKEPPARTRIHRQYKPLIDPYKEYLIKRWNEGCRNAQLVYREIKEQGYTGSDQPIARFFAQFRQKKERRKFKQVDPSNETAIKAVPKRPPTASQVAHWITFKEDQRLEWQQQYLTQLCASDPEIAQAYELIETFTTMLRERQGERLDSWLAQVEAQGASELKSFAQGLKKDYDAVKAGLTLSWSQGPVEGHVHRLKLLKRQMYGKAGFHTLRKRVLRCG